MVNLFSMSSLIQFVGAFNFANVFAKFEDLFMQDFLKVDDMIKSEYGEVTAKKIQLGIETIPNYEPLILEGDRGSNAHEIEKLKSEFNNLLTLEERTRVLITTMAEIDNRMKYASPMFLICGLYTTLILFVYALLDMYKDDSLLCVSFALYNIFMFFFIGYFVLCEVLKHSLLFANHRLLRPSVWWCLVSFLIVSLLPLGNYLLLAHGICLFYIGSYWIDFWIWSSIVLSLSGFLVTFIFTLTYYSISKRTVKKNAKKLNKKFEKVFKDKEFIDRMYSSFNQNTSSNIRFS